MTEHSLTLFQTRGCTISKLDFTINVINAIPPFTNLCMSNVPPAPRELAGLLGLDYTEIVTGESKHPSLLELDIAAYLQ